MAIIMAILMLCHFLTEPNTLQHIGHFIRHQRIKKFSHSFILFFIIAWLSSNMYITFHVQNHVYWIQMCTAYLEHCICFEDIKNLTTLWALITDTSSTQIYVVITAKASNMLAEVVMLLPCIRETPSLNLGWDTDHPQTFVDILNPSTQMPE